jgi:hypothetical protein
MLTQRPKGQLATEENETNTYTQAKAKSRQLLQYKFNKFNHAKPYAVRNKYMHIFPFNAINNLITEKVPL